MVQIIQSGPTAATIRQAALDDAIKTAIGGFAQMEQNKLQKEATTRQRALQNLQIVADLRGQGFDVSPEQIDQIAANGSLGEIFNKRTPEYMQKQESMQNKATMDAEDRELERQFKRAQIKKMETEEEIARKEKGAPLDPTKKLSKMSAEAQGKVAGIASALDAIGGMEQAILSGSGPERITADTPLIGGFVSDTPYTQNERLVAEVVGRLQSGGAISADELKTFKSLGPRAGDSPDIQQAKISQQRSFLQNKLIGFGLKPEELEMAGFVQTKRRPQNEALQSVAGGFNPSMQRQGIIPNANASAVKPQHQETVKRMSDQDLMNYLGLR